MKSRKFLFTSESVTEGHPDKVCDQISDAILDEFLTKDTHARVAAETTVTTGMVLVSGEITADCYVDIPQVVRNTIKDIGYVGETSGGFDCGTCAVLTSIDEQSTDIAGGVNKALETRSENADTAVKETEELGAGDQGIMFGFACNETPTLMPAPVYYSHLLLHKAHQLRHDGEIKWLRPDAKSQVTVEYDENHKPVRIAAVVLSHQHDDNITHEEIENTIINQVIKPVLEPTGLLDENTKYYINPTGRFVTGGPDGDSGLTGRKIIVDTYGGMGRHGGGAFSGKDPSKVDRSAAYMARYIAKNIVAADLADRAEVELAYAIGVPYPVSILVETFGTEKVERSKIEAAVEKVFDCTPAGIVKTLQLKQPIYRKTASYGHFGREGFPWEKTDKVEALKAEIN